MHGSKGRGRQRLANFYFQLGLGSVRILYNIGVCETTSSVKASNILYTKAELISSVTKPAKGAATNRCLTATTHVNTSSYESQCTDTPNTEKHFLGQKNLLVHFFLKFKNETFLREFQTSWMRNNF